MTITQMISIVLRERIISPEDRREIVERLEQLSVKADNTNEALTAAYMSGAADWRRMCDELAWCLSAFVTYHSDHVLVEQIMRMRMNSLDALDKYCAMTKENENE